MKIKQNEYLYIHTNIMNIYIYIYMCVCVCVPHGKETTVFYCIKWVGVGGLFLMWWSSPTTCHCQGCLNNPIFSNSGLCAARWAHFMYHHELCPTSLSHHFSLLKSFRPSGEKNYHRILFLSLDLSSISSFSRLLSLYPLESCLYTSYSLDCYCSIWPYLSPRK